VIKQQVTAVLAVKGCINAATDFVSYPECTAAEGTLTKFGIYVAAGQKTTEYKQTKVLER